MYERFYSLKEKPFSLTPDPEFLFLNKRFRDALDQVIYGIKRHEGFTAIVGDVGTGKTTLCWALLRRLEENIRSALILNSLLTEEDMLRAIIQDFGVKSRKFAPPPASGESAGNDPYNPAWMYGLSRKELIDELNYFLLDRLGDDVINVLIIDEAQNLSPGVLEQLRILSNLETAKRKLLQIIFVGQLEFEQKLRMPELRQLRQRITIRYELRPLSMADTAQYIEHRLKVAGATRHLEFNRGALRRIYKYTAGYPRLINIICDRALLAGYSERSFTVTGKIVRKAARGLGMTAGAARPKVRFAGTGKALVPILGLLILALLAAVVAIWTIRGFPSGVSSWFYRPISRSSAATAPQESGNATASHPGALPTGTAAADPAASHGPPAEPEKQTAAAFAAERPRSAASDPSPDVTPSRGEVFLLQVHSLLSLQQADQVAADLRGKGYPAFVKVVPAGSREWFTVYVGPFNSLEKTQESLSSLRSNERVAPIIRRPDGFSN